MKKKSEKLLHELKRRISRNVARLRAAGGLTFESLGKRAGLHPRHVQKIEAGEFNATLETMARLAEGLDVDAFDLMRKEARA